MKRSALGLMLFASVVSSQQPQTQTAPIYPVNAKYAQGVAPGYWPTAGAGLTLNLTAGTAFCSGAVQTYPGGSLTMTASATNYIYLNTSASCAPAAKTTAFVTADIPLATVIAGASAITSLADDRTFFTQPGNGSGSWTAGQDLSGSSTSQQVVGIEGQPLPALASGYPHWTGSAWVYDTPSAGGGNPFCGVNAQTGTAYTLVLGDGTVSGVACVGSVTMNNAATNTVTIPANSNVSFPTPDEIDFIQLGAGQTCISAASGVTLHTPTSLCARAQNSTFGIRQIAANIWQVFGDTQ